MTVQEAKEMIQQLRKVFSIVRLLDPVQHIEIDPDKMQEDTTPQSHQCYDFWKKGKCCTNCIAKMVSETEPQKTRLEIMDSTMYQIIAKYVEINDKAYVLELVNALDQTVVTDKNSWKPLRSEIADYDKELYIDALTGAYNRKYYEDKLKNTNTPSGVAMIDMDDFKLCNDLYGHQAGDAALRTLSKVILRNIRRSDKLIRYGGDEFVLIMPGITETMFDRKLQHILTTIRNHKIPGYAQAALSVSIGGVLSRGESIDAAVRRADSMMYRAKLQKNEVVTEGELEAFEEQASDHDTLSKKNAHLVLIVDDSAMNREILREILSEDYEIMEASNGEEGMELLSRYKNDISLVLLDIVMPGMDGFEVLRLMQENGWTDSTPVMMISSEEDVSFIRQAYELGAVDYITRPFDAQIVQRRADNTVRLYEKQRRLTGIVKQQMKEKEKNSVMMIHILSHIVEFRNGESGLHVQHINMMTNLMLECLTQKTDKYHLTKPDQQLITTASSLHDIGKIGIDDKILNKPGKLTEDEFSIMKQHTLIGASMLNDMKLYREEPLVKIAYQICRWHHERYDGKGYPDGLKGEEIPIAAQVVSIVDAYDALISERVYKKAYSHEKAMSMIQEGACGVFNPLLLECLKEIQGQIKKRLESMEELTENPPDNVIQQIIDPYYDN